MIDVSAVEAVEVDEQEFSVLQPKLDVAAADGDVVEEDVAVRMPARRCDGLIEQGLGRRWVRASRVAGRSGSAGLPRPKRRVQHLRRPGRPTRREGERETRRWCPLCLRRACGRCRCDSSLCPGPFWRCGRAKALLERFLEITAPSRALSSLCRIDPGGWFGAAINAGPRGCWVICRRSDGRGPAPVARRPAGAGAGA